MSEQVDVFGATYEKDEVIFREGDSGDKMYLIQSGAVEITKNLGGEETVLAVLGPGEFFGEMALIDPQPRSATGKAVIASRLIQLTRKSILDRIRQDQGITLHLLQGLSQRIKNTSKTLELLRKELIETSTEQSEYSYAEENGENSVQKTDIEIVKRDMPTGHQEGSPPSGGSSSESLQLLAESISNSGTEIEWRRYQPNDIIFEQNDPGDCMYFISKGLVEISLDRDGAKTPLSILGVNDCFGEMALVTGNPRSARAMTLEATVVLPLSRETFQKHVQSHPEMAFHLLRVMVQRLRLNLEALENPWEAPVTLERILPPYIQKNSRVTAGFLSLSTCGGCPAVLLENPDDLANLLEKVEILYCPMLTDETEILEVDVVFIDGAVRTADDLDTLLEARRKSCYLASWGTCSTYGGIPAMANRFEIEELIEESFGESADTLSFYLSGSKRSHVEVSKEGGVEFLRKVGKVGDFVMVDYFIAGCPPSQSHLSDLIFELVGEPPEKKKAKLVCAICGRKSQKGELEQMKLFPNNEESPAHCFVSLGIVCMGSTTRGGCNALCPKNGLPCWGCRGPSDVTIKKMVDGKDHQVVIQDLLAKRSKLGNESIQEALNILSYRGNRPYIYDPYLLNIIERLK